jgi:hypothetical protein
MVFDVQDRANKAPLRFNESRFSFLNRSASHYFERMRSLIDEWISHVPQEHRWDLITQSCGQVAVDQEGAGFLLS